VSNLHVLWAELLVDALAGAGVRHAVVSPGSRSTPLALAAARHPRLACTVVVDERCASFVALGQARVTGMPSLLLCTSGTAGAHYLPAVVEASEASVPLLVLTADRPPELQARGALQTVRQASLFGAFVRTALELGVPDPHPMALAGVRATAALAVQATLDPRPGAVHLNAPFRAPLEPQLDDGDERGVRAHVQRLLATPVARAAPARRQAAPALVEALAAACAGASRGVMVVGPGGVSQAAARQPLAALARRLGFPVAAEAGSQLRFGPGSPSPIPLELLVGEEMPQPDLVVVVGSWPTSAGWNKVLGHAAVPRPWVVCEHGWVDPCNRAAAVVVGEVATTLQQVAQRLGAGAPRDPTWLAAWNAAATQVAEVLAQAEAQERASGALSETAAVRAAVRAAPEGTWLALGNSLAIREVDLACPGGEVHLKVLTQRGVSGIDGSISAAAGAALAAGEPVLLVTGDVAFQHDLGGLASAASVPTPLVIVVLDNRGGRIFQLLPLAGGAVPPEEVERLFIAPQRLDVYLAAQAFGVPVRRVRTVQEVEEAVGEALAVGGCTVVHAVIGSGDLRQRRRALQEAAQALWPQAQR
jgi:2-succinyl-5-enolpyruvyl-6-hydroxy-3-cyclohexene-1-carboxylate synthase